MAAFTRQIVNNPKTPFYLFVLALVALTGVVGLAIFRVDSPPILTNVVAAVIGVFVGIASQHDPDNRR